MLPATVESAGSTDFFHLASSSDDSDAEAGSGGLAVAKRCVLLACVRFVLLLGF